jgi:hypothetical protein
MTQDLGIKNMLYNNFIHPQGNDKFAYHLFGYSGFFVEAGAGNIGNRNPI